ncbi:retinal pigment epithelial membrane protein-domain-containing protein [Lasiosphaeria miniovina]|uniref:Retinal pigment epithelial membrane protein-domain-containing protein n=1 Tax=Lasiosphaeria miniovina TaxID=1954250 RepID=A0AA40AWR6_9PEZI|nr:retinal pigment epithelial membrane protein-domain-containing protein [Lasiosphaeria miniovina]KAK0723437.1 retinal pigment epithelial membrane protein-domain-containing protein [Lasiosphaeria miniovina]
MTALLRYFRLLQQGASQPGQWRCNRRPKAGRCTLPRLGIFSGSVVGLEPAFIPRAGSTEEGDGYLVVLVSQLHELRNDVCILDARNIAKGPLAVVHLPFKLRLGLHSNFVEQAEIDAWKGRHEAKLGPVKPLSWQKKAGRTGSQGTGTESAV